VAYEDFVRTRILEPCEMRSARFLLRKGDEHGVATPYRLDNGMASVMPHEWYVTTSTSSLVATATDMARFAMLHLSDGECAGRQILGKSLVRAMRTQQATVHPAVPGWGYALQLDEVNGRKVAEHGGDIGGFSSLLVLIPEEHAGFFVVNHGEGNDLRFAIKSALFDGLYPASHARTAPQPDPAAATSLREYAGRYRSSLACHTCPNVGQEQDFELTVGSGGVLQLWGQQWVPLEHDLFVRTDGTRLLGFARDDGGRIAAVSGGSWRVADRLSE